MVGKNVIFGQNVFVRDNTTIGDGCKVQNNVSLYSRCTLSNNVFCRPSVVFTNVINPRAIVNERIQGDVSCEVLLVQTVQ